MLEAFITDVFKGVGVPGDEARFCAEVVVGADKRGIYSHGVGRLKPIYYDRIVKSRVQQPVTKFEVVRDCKATAVVDGHHGMGMVIGKRCMEMAIEKARVHGIGTVVARNSTHYGYAAHYPLMAVKANMIGVTATNARPSIAPTHGTENMLGTNPLVFGFPTDEEFPFTNDYATSIIQRGKVEEYARAGVQCPEGLVIDEEGKTETDPNKILVDLIKGKSAFTPVGGMDEETGSHKGYGFATVVEILSASLQQGSFLKQLNGVNEKGQLVPYGLGPFLHGHRHRMLCGYRVVQKDHRGYSARAPRVQEKTRERAHLYLRRERVPQLAEEQGSGRAGGRRHPEGIVRDAR